MKKFPIRGLIAHVRDLALISTSVLAAGTFSATAGGIERLPQSLAPLFESGNYVELTFGHLRPDVTGRDVGGPSTKNVGENYSFFGFAYKHQVNDRVSAALIVEQPFGVDMDYPADGSVMFGDTSSSVNATTYTALLRYHGEGGFGVHGGLRASHMDGTIALNGAALGAVDGYHLRLRDDWAAGYVLGASYARPATATVISLTYQSTIKHDFDTTESGPLAALNGDSSTRIRVPQSWNLEAQTAISPTTLLMGSVRWVKWSEFKVDPERFYSVTGDGMVRLSDTTTYTLGLARKLSDRWTGVATILYEPSSDMKETPLTPTNGRKGITLAGVYTQGPLKVTTAVGYFKLGDTHPATGTPPVERTDFTDSDTVAIAVRVGYSF
ncbi:MAG: OmpP1/FadL family transporter [Paracoccus sp. (in: a-proteobacteria)]